MEFFDVVDKRHSIRAYKDKEVEEEKLRKILETANKAPSAGNLQAYEIFVVKDQNKRKALAEAAFSQDFIVDAPVVLVFCSNPTRSSWKGKRGGLYSLQDATIAACYAQLAVTALGLSSCWVGAFSEEEVLKILGSPKGLVPICIMPIGYAAEEPEITGRRSLKDIVHEV
jgi:nitroreductase